MRIKFLLSAAAISMVMSATHSAPLGFEDRPTKRKPTAIAASSIKEEPAPQVQPPAESKPQPKPEAGCPDVKPKTGVDTGVGNKKTSAKKRKVKPRTRKTKSDGAGVAFQNSKAKNQKEKPSYFYAHSAAQHYGVLFYDYPCRAQKAISKSRADLIKAGLDYPGHTVLRHAISKLPSGEEHGCWYVDPRVGSFNIRLNDGITEEFAREQVEKVTW